MMPTSPNRVSSTPVVSEAARVLTTLLPIRMPPISRSRAASIRLTMPARLSPLRSSASIRARDEAVSAVSLPEKKPEIAKQSSTATREIQTDRSITSCSARAGQFLCEKGVHILRRHTFRDETLTDAPAQNEGESPADHLFVLRHGAEQIIGAADGARNIGKPRRQTRLAQMRLDTARILPAAQPLRNREAEGLRHAQSHGLAMNQTGGIITRHALQGMAESMAEIEQRPLAGLAFVARHDRRLGPAGDFHGVLALGPATIYPRPVGLAPGKEVGITDQAVFDRLGITGTDFAQGQRIQQAGIGEHQARLVEGADQILALRRVDPGLAADGGIDLGEQARRHLNEADAAPHDRGGESGEITHHTAAERDHEIPALDARIENGAADMLQRREGFRSFTGADADGRHPQAGLRQHGG